MRLALTLVNEVASRNEVTWDVGCQSHVSLKPRRCELALSLQATEEGDKVPDLEKKK